MYVKAQLCWERKTHLSQTGIHVILREGEGGGVAWSSVALQSTASLLWMTLAVTHLSDEADAPIFSKFWGLVHLEQCGVSNFGESP